MTLHLHRWQTDPEYVDERPQRIHWWTKDEWRNGEGPAVYLAAERKGLLRHLGGKDPGWGWEKRHLRCIKCPKTRRQWRWGNPPAQGD